MLCETVMIVPFLKASASPKIKPTWNGPEITSRFHVKSKGGWGGVFDAPASPNRGVEDSAPATPGLLLFREFISGLFPSPARRGVRAHESHGHVFRCGSLAKRLEPDCKATSQRT